MNVLEEAEALINGDRQEQYGNASESHQRIANLWAGYLDTPVTDLDVVNMMILLKVSRTKGTYHRDSYVDIAGYAAIGERIEDEYQEDLEIRLTGVPLSTDPVGQDFEDWLAGWPGFSDVPEQDRFFIEHLDAPLQPRVWESVEDIPKGVRVEDNDGDSFEAPGAAHYLIYSEDLDYENVHHSPFTEVIGTE